MPTRCELYVYYRVARDQCAGARAQVEAQQARLRATLPGLDTRLLRRQGEGEVDDRDPTWMEIYRIPSGLDDPTCAQIEAALRDWPQARVGPRIVERFVPVDTPIDAPPVS
jgi:hypothetical protein